MTWTIIKPEFRVYESPDGEDFWWELCTDGVTVAGSDHSFREESQVYDFLEWIQSGGLGDVPIVRVPRADLPG